MQTRLWYQAQNQEKKIDFFLYNLPCLGNIIDNFQDGYLKLTFIYNQWLVTKKMTKFIIKIYYLNIEIDNWWV
jgi:hypothetical protein